MHVLELDDIQHFLLTRPPALDAARYEFLSFRQPAGGRELARGHPGRRCSRPRRCAASVDKDNRWVTVAFTWNGLRALGVDEASLATFPEEFKQGMAARAEILGDTGANHPDHWVGGLASPDLHAIVILFARDVAERERCVSRSTEQLVAQLRGRRSALVAGPGGDAAVRSRPRPLRLSRPAVAAGHRRDRATSRPPAPARPLKAGEFILGYPDEDGPRRPTAAAGGPFAATAASWPIGGWRSTSARSATSSAQNGETPEEQELIAAKLMGRWRSGAPLVLAPDKDDPALGADPQRNNDFNYKEMDPHGLCRAAGRAHPADESARHGREHEPPPHDPPRRPPTARICPRARPRTAWSEGSRPS